MLGRNDSGVGAVDSQLGNSEGNGTDTNLEQDNHYLIILFSFHLEQNLIECILLTILSNILDCL